jgi:hypothetical protein
VSFMAKMQQVLLEGELRIAISVMLSSHGEQGMIVACLARVGHTIEFVGHTIQKSMLVSQLNNVPFSFIQMKEWPG